MVPVIDLETVAAGVQLRVSRDRNCIYYAQLQTATHVCMSVMAALPRPILRTGNDAFVVGTCLFLLAPGQGDQLNAWLAEHAAACVEGAA